MRNQRPMRRSVFAGLVTSFGLICLIAVPVSAGAPELSATLTRCEYPTMTNAALCEPFGPSPIPDTSVRMWMGSDSGVVCAETRLPDLGEASFTGWTTYVTLGQPTAGSPRLFLIPTTNRGELTEGCVSGVDPLVVSDLFTNPGAYWILAQVVEANPLGSPGCPWDCPKIAGQFGFASDPGGAPVGGPAGGGMPDAATAAATAAAQPWPLLAGGLLLTVIGLQRLRRPREGFRL